MSYSVLLPYRTRIYTRIGGVVHRPALGRRALGVLPSQRWWHSIQPFCAAKGWGVASDLRVASGEKVVWFPGRDQLAYLAVHSAAVAAYFSGSFLYTSAMDVTCWELGCGCGGARVCGKDAERCRARVRLSLLCVGFFFFREWTEAEPARNPTSGSSGLGSEKREQMERRSRLMVRAGDHPPCKISTQIPPVVGWAVIEGEASERPGCSHTKEARRGRAYP